MKPQNVLIGRSSGSIGNATFTKWKGINVVRSKPITVEQPNTDAQLNQRARMRVMVALFRQISAAILFGFRELAINRSEYNAFVSSNIMSATNIVSTGVAAIVWNSLKTARGTIFETTIDSVSSASGSDAVTINYASTANQPGQSLTDTAIAVVVNTTQDTYGIATSGATRSSGSITVTMPTNNALNDTLECYLAFFNQSSQKASDSTYMQEVV